MGVSLVPRESVDFRITVCQAKLLSPTLGWKLLVYQHPRPRSRNRRGTLGMRWGYEG